MKKVFICSPLRGDIEANKEKARAYSLMAVQAGYLPITPHIYFTQFLDDGVEEERNAGIEMGIRLLKECDEMWVFGQPTEGMRREIEAWGKEYIQK